MRRLAKVLLAATVVMSMSLTAMAAGSVTNQYEVESAKDADGNDVVLNFSTATQSLSEADAVDVLAGYGYDVAAEDVKVYLHEITVDGDATFPLTITLAVDGVTSDMHVTVLHYVGGSWQEEDCTVGTGTVTFTVGSLSPIAVVVADADAVTLVEDDADDADTDDADTEETTDDDTTSPETGEASTMAVVMVATIALGAAYVVSRRKVA